MTLEPRIVEQRLKKLDETIRRLEPLAAIPREAFLADFRTHWAAERGIQLAAEAVLDISNHILAGHFDRFPETHEQDLDALRDTGVISPADPCPPAGFRWFPDHPGPRLSQLGRRTGLRPSPAGPREP